MTTKNLALLASFAIILVLYAFVYLVARALNFDALVSHVTGLFVSLLWLWPIYKHCRSEAEEMSK